MEHLGTSLIIAGAFLVLPIACSPSEPTSSNAPGTKASAKPAASSTQSTSGSTQSDEIAVIDVEGFGEIRIEFLPDKAPKTVENFKKLAREGFYDGTTFHRTIPGFMIQGGDPNSKDRDPRNDGTGGPGYTIKAEFNDMSHVPGIVSMARSANPDSAGSQFFIVHGTASHLDGQYTAFGRMISDMGVVDKIANTPRDEFGRNGPRDRPLENATMKSVRIVPR